MAMDKDEVKAMKAKEAKTRKEKLAASALHDAAVMDSMRSSMGVPTAAQAAAPAQPPASMDQMGNTTGMKKGGKVGSASKRADGIAYKGKTRGKMC
jgi:hypothetical protein